MLTSFRIRQILFPTDFSKSSEAAAAHVAGLAHAIGAQVRLLNVVPYLAAWHGVSETYFDGSTLGANPRLESEQRVAETAALKALCAFRKQHLGDVPAEVLVRSGGVANSIVEYADEMDADLIMMPTRGFGPARRFLIGSTTAKVLHDARRPLWTTPHARELDIFRPYRHVVCAMDYRRLSPDLPLRALNVARMFNSRLTIASAIPCAPPHNVPCAGRESMQPVRHETVQALRHLLAELHITATVEVLEGSVGEVVEQAAVFDDADLIVIGHGHLDEPMGHLRTHAYEIIWNAPCPILVV
jgi:nucleotide-binding universal stress UspA family protein